jgi:oxygen-independent coproporphyrinogen-3 oxidase
VIALAPDRISYYNYAHLPERFPAQKAIDASTLPSADEKLRMLCLIIERLTGAGYSHVGMDHFVRNDDPLVQARVERRLSRNFQGYSVEKAEDLVGIGVSSISSVANTYAQNAVQLDRYYKALDNNQLPIERGFILGKEDLLRRDIIQQLSCYRHLDIPELEAVHGIHFQTHFRDAMPALEQFEVDGLVSCSPSAIEVTERGTLLLRNICMVFDEYLDKATTGKPQFSRVI